MKVFRLRIVFFLLLFATGFISYAQLKPKMAIYGYFQKDNSQIYTAEVLTVDDVSFTCKFSHSSSVYTFQKAGYESELKGNMPKATVISSVGGKYKKGDTFLYFAQAADNSTDCFDTPGNIVLVKFPDEKIFVGVVSEGSFPYNVVFVHSGNVYGFDKTLKVVKSNGFYKPGTKAKISCSANVKL